jgi:hypothetical protein
MTLPPYGPSMAAIYRQVRNAINAHWKAHHNLYPQAIVLTSAQAEDLYNCQLYGQVAFPGIELPQRDQFSACPVQIDEASAGEIVAHDGTRTPLADYDGPASAP